MQLPLTAPAPRVLSVTDLARRIRSALENLAEVWVAGEISNFRAPSSGHFYFCLKDDRSQIAAVMFRTANRLLPFRPADGLEVVVRGRISLYDVRGDLQLYVDSMEPRGAGGLQLALEQLKSKLAAEGLFAAERKRALPRWPRSVGLVTALTGAAVHDMLTVLRERWPVARVVISPVRVQGKAAGADIEAALSAICRVEGIDVVIVGRGGGSVEDLWAFNEERVARAIAACPVPVVSAVGHEIDITVADLVADCRAPTPTAAAALVVPDRAHLRPQLEDAQLLLGAAVQRRLRKGREQVESLQRQLRDPRRALEVLRQRVDELGERAAGAVTQRLRWADHRARAAEGRLQALSPLAVLDRGYSIAQRADGHVVRGADEVQPKEELTLRFARGRARVRVEERQS